MPAAVLLTQSQEFLSLAQLRPRQRSRQQCLRETPDLRSMLLGLTDDPPRVTQRVCHHHQRPERTPSLRHRIPYQAEPTEVELSDLTTSAVALGDSDEARTDAVPDDFSVHLDLMSLWLARHINLSVFGRWPGPQVLHTAYERLHEHAENELCGCTSGRLYDQCCRQADLALSPSEVLTQFRQSWPRPTRRVPTDVIDVRRTIWV